MVKLLKFVVLSVLLLLSAKAASSDSEILLETTLATDQTEQLIAVENENDPCVKNYIFIAAWLLIVTAWLSMIIYKLLTSTQEAKAWLFYYLLFSALLVCVFFYSGCSLFRANFRS